MDGQFIASVIKLVVFLPFVIILAYICLKFGSSRIMNMGGGRLIKIVERVPLSNKSYICVAIINDLPYVISSTEEKVEILMELPLESLEKLKKTNGSFKDNLIMDFSQLLKGKEKS